FEFLKTSSSVLRSTPSSLRTLRAVLVVKPHCLPHHSLVGGLEGISGPFWLSSCINIFKTASSNSARASGVSFTERLYFIILACIIQGFNSWRILPVTSFQNHVYLTKRASTRNQTRIIIETRENVWIIRASKT